MNHTDDSIKQLFNDFVDTELGPVRPAPAFDASRSGKLGQWKVPLLAASVVALLAAGSVLAIDASRSQRPAPAAGSPTSRPSSPSPTVAMADGLPVSDYPDGDGLPLVEIKPTTAADAKFKADSISYLTPAWNWKNGQAGSVTMKVVAHDDATSVFILTMRNVKQATCPPGFLAHAGRTYYIRCTSAIALPGQIPQLVLSVPYASTNGGGWTYSANLR